MTSIVAKHVCMASASIPLFEIEPRESAALRERRPSNRPLRPSLPSTTHRLTVHQVRLTAAPPPRRPDGKHRRLMISTHLMSRIQSELRVLTARESRLSRRVFAASQGSRSFRSQLSHTHTNCALLKQKVHKAHGQPSTTPTDGEDQQEIPREQKVPTCADFRRVTAV